MPTTLPDPVIFVPGITASCLADEYPLPPQTIWTALKKNFDRVAIHPDSLADLGKARAYEAQQPARIRPSQIFEIAYEEFVKELRYGLSPSRDLPVPVYPFAYDWRQPLEATEALLADFIDEVIDRTKLMRHYHDAKYAENPRVSLIGHSMGGLIISGCLKTLGSRARVSKVATLATPFQGSFEAVIKVATGTANLGTSPPSSREREVARLTPALYYLKPTFAGHLEIAERHREAMPDPDLADPTCWQPSIVSTIADYVKRHSLTDADPKVQAGELFASMLDASTRHNQRVGRLKLDKVGLTEKDWLCVVGADAVTRVRLRLGKLGDGSFDFELSSDDRRNDWNLRHEDPERGMHTGDGTVPLRGAVPRFLGENQLVCVTPDDFGYWEIGDKVLNRVAGFHGILPNMNMLHRLVIRHLTGHKDKHGNTWGRPAPSVSARDWDPPIKGLRNKD